VADKSRRGLETVADMVRSLGLVVGVVVLLLLITLRPQGQAVHVVDYRAMLAGAKIGGTPFPLVAPQGLPSSWQATSAYYDPPGTVGLTGATVWHVGFVTPTNRYGAFEQTDRSAPDELSDVLPSATREGTDASVDGVRWERWTDGKGGRALVRTAGTVTTVVDGSADWPELEQLAGSLRAGS
jgi:hypothetical protein